MLAPKPVNEITLYPAKPNSNKRSHDEMDVESMLRDNEMAEQADAFVSPAASLPPHLDQDRKSVSNHMDADMGGTAPLQQDPRRSSDMTDTRPHAHPNINSVKPPEATRRVSAPLTGSVTQQTPGPFEPRPKFLLSISSRRKLGTRQPQLQSPRTTKRASEISVPKSSVSSPPSPSFSSLPSRYTHPLTAFPSDNIKVLGPHMVQQHYYQAIQAVGQTEDTASTRIVTLKRGHEWTAAWTYGFNHVILRSAGAGSVAGVLENLLECTSEMLVVALTNDGNLRHMGP